MLDLGLSKIIYIHSTLRIFNFENIYFNNVFKTYLHEKYLKKRKKVTMYTSELFCVTKLLLKQCVIVCVCVCVYVRGVC